MRVKGTSQKLGAALALALALAGAGAGCGNAGLVGNGDGGVRRSLRRPLGWRRGM